eukprot:superscaffoldBa00004973_g19727
MAGGNVWRSSWWSTGWHMGLSYSIVSRVFDVLKTAVFDNVHPMCDAILALLSIAVHFPTLTQCAEVGHGFQQLANSPAFSHCVGAIDGCHIRIKDPHSPHTEDYFNRKMFHSVQLQAICDITGKYLDIFVGYPGSVHDTKVIRNSPVFVRGSYPPAGYFIVRDGGYPCLTALITLITPYHEPVRGRVQARFNTYHSRAWAIIERAFGMMKARWRRMFFKALEVDHTFAPKVMAVCAVLHTSASLLGTSWSRLKDPVQRDECGGQHYKDRLAAQVPVPNQRPSPLQEHDYFIL